MVMTVYTHYHYGMLYPIHTDNHTVTNVATILTIVNLHAMMKLKIVVKPEI